MKVFLIAFLAIVLSLQVANATCTEMYTRCVAQEKADKPFCDVNPHTCVPDKDERRGRGSPFTCKDSLFLCESDCDAVTKRSFWLDHKLLKRRVVESCQVKYSYKIVRKLEGWMDDIREALMDQVPD